MNGEAFDFRTCKPTREVLERDIKVTQKNSIVNFFVLVLKPISARLKIIINKSNEARILKLLIDFVLQDAALQLSHQQYLALVQLSKSFHRITINRLETETWTTAVRQTEDGMVPIPFLHSV